MTKILLVEDEASFSEALSYVLGKEGFEVVLADTGDGASQLLIRVGLILYY